MIEARWQQAAAAEVGAGADARWRSMDGSALSRTWMLSADERYFVKSNAAVRLSMLEAEAEGLREIERTGTIRVPHPFATGAVGDTAYLVLEFLDLASDGCAAALGASLAALHRVTAPRFGWRRDNTIGLTPQLNEPCGDWTAFWRERRLRPQFELAARNGFQGRLQTLGAALELRLPEFFAGYLPQASLLHGDLWGGNWGCSQAGVEPVVFDPAPYYGDRETDLAMTELFGGFPREFYDTYAAAWPLDPGYARRQPLYQLYHVLNHLNLFGGTYLAQAVHLSERLLEI